MEPPLSAAIIFVDVPRSTKSTSAKRPEHVVAEVRLAGRSSLTWVIDAVLAASVRRIAVVGLEPSAMLRAELDRRNDRALIDVVPRSSNPLADIERATERLAGAFSSDAERPLLLLPAELPTLEPSCIRLLLREHRRHEATATRLACSATDNDSQALTTEPLAISTTMTEGVGTPQIDQDESKHTNAACFDSTVLMPALRLAVRRGDISIRPADAAEALRKSGHKVVEAVQTVSIKPIRTHAEKSEAELVLRRRIRNRWIERGVHMPLKDTVSIDADVELAQGVSLLPGTVLEGETIIGDGSVIGPNTHVVDASIGADCVVPQASVTRVDIEAGTRMSPFSVLS